MDLLQHSDTSAIAEDSVLHEKVKLLSIFTGNNTAGSVSIGDMEASMQPWDFIVENNSNASMVTAV